MTVPSLFFVWMKVLSDMIEAVSGAFSKSQLQEIRTSSLARVVCDCMDDVEKLQPFLFLQPDTLANIRTSCRGDGKKF